MSLHQSLTRAGFPVDLSHYFGYGLDFATGGMGDDDGTGVGLGEIILRIGIHITP